MKAAGVFVGLSAVAIPVWWTALHRSTATRGLFVPSGAWSDVQVVLWPDMLLALVSAALAVQLWRGRPSRPPRRSRCSGACPCSCCLTPWSPSRSGSACPPRPRRLAGSWPRCCSSSRAPQRHTVAVLEEVRAERPRQVRLLDRPHHLVPEHAARDDVRRRRRESRARGRRPRPAPARTRPWDSAPTRRDRSRQAGVARRTAAVCRDREEPSRNHWRDPLLAAAPAASGAVRRRAS